MFGIVQRQGWYFTPTFNVYQKVNQGVYCYVSRQLGFYTVQLYKRGTADSCLLEARSKTNIEALFELGEEWLDRYQTFDLSRIRMSPYYIGNPSLRDEWWIH